MPFKKCYWHNNCIIKRVIELFMESDKNKETNNEVNVDTTYKVVYADTELIHFPYVTKDHPEYNEWELNREVGEKFGNYIKDISVKTILHFNCENGWFTNIIAKNNYAKVLGFDNDIESLKQSQRVFLKDNLVFSNKNVFTSGQKFDVIVLSNALNKYQDHTLLISQLKSILNEHGEIHILEFPAENTLDINALDEFKILNEPKSTLKKILGKKVLPLAWYIYSN